MRKDQHVTPNAKGGWGVRSTGASRPSRVFSNKDDAVQHARHVARRERSELFVHGRDGSIREHDSYVSNLISSSDRR